MRHTTSSRRSRTSLALATALALAGCSESAGGSIATYDSGGSGMDALLSGTLSITDACVTVTGPDGTRSTPAFDGGARLRDGVLVFHDREYADGARIELGGGETTALSRVRLPAGCPTEHVFLVAPG